jgi:hypothetical protein
VQPEEDGYEDENIPVHICSGVARVADDGVPEGDGGDVSGRDTSQSKYYGGPMEAGKMQQTDRSGSGMETSCPDNASFPVAAICSGEALVPTTLFALSSYDPGESCPAIVDVSAFTIVEILDKQSGGSDAQAAVAGRKLGRKGADSSGVTRTDYTSGRFKTLRIGK